MAPQLSVRKKLLFSFFTTVVLFTLLNAIAIPFADHDSVFWNNPLMVMYPVDSFNLEVAQEKANYNKDPQRAVRYVPDDQRWYRLEPEPEIPAEGKLVLHFGDSSTWGWGLLEQIRRQGAYAGAIKEFLPPNMHSVNLGVPGYSSFQGLRYMEEVIPRYHRRIAAVTLYFGNNDATENGNSDTDKLLETPSTVASWLTVFPLYRAMSRGVQALWPSNNQQPRVNSEAYGENIQQMIALARQYDIPVVLIAPQVPLTWKPAHLNWTISLQNKVNNSWTAAELTQAQVRYAEGIALAHERKDCCEHSLRAAIEHDWVLPRIKQAWSKELRRIALVEDVPLIELPQASIEAELWRFEDYCHPSLEAHAELARAIARALGHSK